jgi:hypothetical protein
MLQIATRDPHTKGLILENGEEIAEISLDFYSEDRAEWERLADERIQEAGFVRVSDWADTDLGNTATIVRA